MYLRIPWRFLASASEIGIREDSDKHIRASGESRQQLEGIVGCLTLTAHSESSQKISPPTFGSTMTLLTFCATPTVQCSLQSGATCLTPLFSADQIQTFAFLYELKSDGGLGVSL